MSLLGNRVEKQKQDWTNNFWGRRANGVKRSTAALPAATADAMGCFEKAAEKVRPPSLFSPPPSPLLP